MTEWDLAYMRRKVQPAPTTLLQQALDALENPALPVYTTLRKDIRMTLAAPQPEPVGQVLSDAQMGIGYDRRMGDVIWWNKPPGPAMLYAAPPAAPVPSNQLSGNSGELNLIPPADMVMVPTHLSVGQLEAFVGHGLCCGTEPMPEAVIDAGHKWTRLLGKIAAAPAPAAPDFYSRQSPLVQDAMGIAMVKAWSIGGRTDAVHPDFQRGFEAAWESAAPAVREPLTPDVIWRLWTKACEKPQLTKGLVCDFARAIEQAYGIGGGGK